MTVGLPCAIQPADPEGLGFFCDPPLVSAPPPSIEMRVPRLQELLPLARPLPQYDRTSPGARLERLDLDSSGPRSQLRKAHAHRENEYVTEAFLFMFTRKALPVVVASDNLLPVPPPASRTC